MTDIARVVASLACCGGLFVVGGLAWAVFAVAGLAASHHDRYL